MAKKRKSVPKDREARILDLCRRRCCVCFALNRDSEEKSGQIAHLDHNPANNAIENLAFLCLDHHDQYDSTTSQAKNLTMAEVRRYRGQLHDAVKDGNVPEHNLPRTLRFSDYVSHQPKVNVSGSGNVVSGGAMNLTINVRNTRSRKAKTPIIPGTVAEDARMIGYLHYLARRYIHFKEWGCNRSGDKMRYPLIYKSFEREIGYSMLNTPHDLFDNAAAYLQKRIRNTRLGRNQRGRKIFRTFEEFDERAKPDEDLPTD